MERLSLEGCGAVSTLETKSGADMESVHQTMLISSITKTSPSLSTSWPCFTRQIFFFSRMRSEGSRFTWGSGGEAAFAKSCVCDRNRPQPSATVCVRAVRLSTVASASGVVLKASQVDWLSPQLYWRLQRRCLCEWSVSPQLYWRLQRTCLCEWSVSPHLYSRFQRRCLCQGSVSPDVSVPQECQERVSHKSVLQECQARSVLQECLTRVSYKSVLQECQVRSVK